MAKTKKPCNTETPVSKENTTNPSYLENPNNSQKVLKAINECDFCVSQAIMSAKVGSKNIEELLVAVKCNLENIKKSLFF
jgi:hypothetical protein